jgi:hypothetical protein
MNWRMIMDISVFLDPTPVLATILMLAIGYAMFDTPVVFPSRIEEVSE